MCPGQRQTVRDRRLQPEETAGVQLAPRPGDTVVLDVDIREEDATTVGLYHSAGSLLEETVSGPDARQYERRITPGVEPPCLLFVSAWDTAVDVSVRILSG